MGVTMQGTNNLERKEKKARPKGLAVRQRISPEANIP